MRSRVVISGGRLVTSDGRVVVAGGRVVKSGGRVVIAAGRVVIAGGRVVIAGSRDMVLNLWPNNTVCPGLYETKGERVGRRQKEGGHGGAPVKQEPHLGCEKQRR